VALLPVGSAAFGGVKSSGAAGTAELLVDLSKYLRNIWAGITLSGADDSARACGGALSVRGTTPGGDFGAEAAGEGGTLSVWETAGAGSAAGTGTGKTNRFVQGQCEAMKRNGAGPIRGK